jgi:hypothetical protein
VQGERRKAKGESKISADRRSFVFMMERLKGIRVQGTMAKPVWTPATDAWLKIENRYLYSQVMIKGKTNQVF